MVQILVASRRPYNNITWLFYVYGPGITLWQSYFIIHLWYRLLLDVRTTILNGCLRVWTWCYVMTIIFHHLSMVPIASRRPFNNIKWLFYVYGPGITLWQSYFIIYLWCRLLLDVRTTILYGCLRVWTWYNVMAIIFHHFSTVPKRP